MPRDPATVQKKLIQVAEEISLAIPHLKRAMKLLKQAGEKESLEHDAVERAHDELVRLVQ